MAGPVRCTLHGERYGIRHPSSVIRLQGFTLVEIVVALGILVMVVGFSGVIFQRSIGSYRTSMAQAEIMRKLRVITEQLDSDFRGLRKDAPMYIRFEKGTNPVYDTNNRFDQIMFFADGDFQSTQTYNSKSVVGNVARIYYGQARSIDPLDKNLKYPDSLRPFNRLLARRQHIFTADTVTFPAWYDFSKFTTTFTWQNNDYYEYDSNSVSQWQSEMQNIADVNWLAYSCFDNRPIINTANANSIHNLMTEGIGSFSIQWDYITRSNVNPAQAHFWWPALDPDGNPATSLDSDFDGSSSLHLNPIGIYFNSAYPGSGWFKPTEAQGSYYPAAADRPAYPKALKFVFVIYDSRGVFPNGQTFSHIVYLGD
jgi:type II secretory pathway pseudopilin PulG